MLSYMEYIIETTAFLFPHRNTELQQLRQIKFTTEEKSENDQGWPFINL